MPVLKMSVVALSGSRCRTTRQTPSRPSTELSRLNLETARCDRSFGPLGEDVILTVADKFLTELQSQLDERQVVVEVMRRQGSGWLRGYDATMGARPMGESFKSTLKAVADMVLFGSLVKGGTAMVTVASDRAGLVIEADVEAEEPVGPSSRLGEEFVDGSKRLQSTLEASEVERCGCSIQMPR